MKNNKEITNTNEIHGKYTFLNLLFTELKFSLTIGKIIGMLVGGIILPILFSFISVFISGLNGDRPSAALLTLLMLTNNAVAFYIFSRVASSVNDKATVDKNKSAFMYYGKNKVTLSKLIVEFFMFAIGFFSLCIIAIIAAKSHTTSLVVGDFIVASIKMFPPFVVLHMFIYSLAKWVVSFINKKSLAYGASLLIALAILTPIFILNQISDTSVLNFAVNRGGVSQSKNFFQENQLATSFIPYMNIGLISGVGQYSEIPSPIATLENHWIVYTQARLLDSDWYVLVPMIYSIVAIAATWNLQSGAQKRYLAAS